MSEFWKFLKSKSETRGSLFKIYWLLFVLILSLFNIFRAAPGVIEKTPPGQVGTIKERVFNITIAALIFDFLLRAYLWKTCNKLEKEKKKIETTLKINPKNPIALKQLQQIKSRKKNYITKFKFIFILIFCSVVGFLIYTIFTPLLVLEIELCLICWAQLL